MQTPPASPNGTTNGYASNGNGSGNGNGHSKNGYLPLVTHAPVTDQGDDFDLAQLVTVLKRRATTFVGVTLLALGGLTLWHFTRPPIYRGGVDLLVEPVTTVDRIDLTDAATGRQSSGLDYTSQIRVLRSPAVIEPILAGIQQRYPEITYNALLSGLTISRDGDSKVLRVVYSGDDPEQVQFVTAQLADGFINYSIQDRQAEKRRGLEFIETQIEEKWQEVAAIEDDLSAFQKQYDLVDVGAASASVTERLNQMQAQQENFQVELTSLDSFYDILLSQVGFSPDTAIRVSNLSESPTYQSLLAELREVDQAIATESARFQVETPMIEALNDQRQQLLPLLEEEAARVLATSIDPDALGHQGSISRGLMDQLVDTANQIQVLQTRDQAVSQVAQDLQNEIQRLADLSRLYQQIARELTVAEDNLNQLLNSRQTLRFQMARETSPWQMVSPPSQASVTPLTNLPRQLLFSTVVSLLLGGGAALLIDKMDQVFHDADDMVKSVKLPNLALVPLAPELKKRPLLFSPRLVSTLDEALLREAGAKPKDGYTNFRFTEAFYSLDTNLRLLSSDSPIQVVALTSSEVGEGKSTVSAHLAIAAANMGRRVLLIDGDMRQPTQHLLFGVPNHQGLSDVLTQPQVQPMDLVTPFADNPNLYLLTAGTLPPAPGRLLASRKMQHIVEDYRHHYDLIIFDTPPLIGITDAKLAASYADGLLLVGRLHKTQRSSMKRAFADLQNTAQAPVLGLVVNGANRPRRNSHDYYYYGYGSLQGSSSSSVPTSSP